MRLSKASALVAGTWKLTDTAVAEDSLGYYKSGVSRELTLIMEVRPTDTVVASDTLEEDRVRIAEEEDSPGRSGDSERRSLPHLDKP